VYDQRVAVPFGTSDFKALDLCLQNGAFLCMLTSLGLSQCEPLFCSTTIALQRQKVVNGKWVTYTFNDASAETTCEFRSSIKIFLDKLSSKAHERVCRHHLRIPSSELAVFLCNRFLSFRNPDSVCKSIKHGRRRNSQCSQLSLRLAESLDLCLETYNLLVLGVDNFLRCKQLR
jgi:hypothetical protein